MKKLLVMTAALLLTLPQAFAQDDTSTQTVQEKDTTTTTSTTDTKDEAKVSKGGFFIEPMIFGSQEDTSIKTSQLPLVNGDTNGTARSYGLGLRLGGHVSEIVMLGLDARYAKSHMEGSFYDSADADVYNIAPVVGLQTPLAGIRLFAGYVLAGENDPKAGSGGFDLKFKEATGWRFGAGVHVLAVAVTLEYQDLTYNTTEVQSSGVGTFASNTNLDVDAESKGYTLSVGFPVEF